MHKLLPPVAGAAAPKPVVVEPNNPPPPVAAAGLAAAPPNWNELDEPNAEVLAAVFVEPKPPVVALLPNKPPCEKFSNDH